MVNALPPTMTEKTEPLADLLQAAISSETPLGAALRLRASREGASAEQVVLGILRKQLAAELDEVAGVLPLATLIQHVIQAGIRSE